ncbi:MAG: hypothetical protein NXI32_20685 [bacterium]|nr:hypothetical protein [bacterium]
MSPTDPQKRTDTEPQPMLPTQPPEQNRNEQGIRTISGWLPTLLWAAVAAIGVGGSASVLSESLWVDELHTSWAISGPADELEFRARAGNQSPLYPAIVRAMCWTLGQFPSASAARFPPVGVFAPQKEWMLRLPSLLSFGLCILCVGCICQQMLGMKLGVRAFSLRKELVVPTPDQTAQATDHAFAWADVFLLAAAGLLWISLDRVQLFYATEARVYGMLQVLSLLGWWSLYRMFCATRPTGVGQRVDLRNNILMWGGIWLLLGLLSIYLHLIAVLCLAWQIAAFLLLAVWKHRKDLLVFGCISMLLLAVLSIPSLLPGVPVWQRRGQWSTFAGDASLQTVVGLFPLIPLVLTLIVGNLLDLSWSWLRSVFLRRPLPPCCSPDAAGQLFFWAVAFVGPWVTAWLLTVNRIAPLMHRRYVLCAALPLVIFAILLLFQMRSRMLRSVVLLVAFGWMAASQGTMDVWRSGQWVGWQRGEDWRSASAWIQSRVESNTAPASSHAAPNQAPVLPEVWCASGLIEGNQAQPPLSSELDAYLSFPLRGIYCVADGQGGFLEPRALVDDASRWIEQWGPIQERRSLFLVARTDARTLAEILQLMQKVLGDRGSSLEVIEGPLAFGMITAVYIQCDAK